MTGRPAAFSALALASTASVADSEIAATRAETLVGMGSIVAPGGRCPAALWHPVGRLPRRIVAPGGQVAPPHCGTRWPVPRRDIRPGRPPPRAAPRFDAGAHWTYTAWTG